MDPKLQPLADKRYVVAVGRWGMYFFDNQTQKSLDLQQVADLLNQTTSRIVLPDTIEAQKQIAELEQQIHILGKDQPLTLPIKAELTYPVSQPAPIFKPSNMGREQPPANLTCPYCDSKDLTEITQTQWLCKKCSHIFPKKKV